MSEKRLPVSHRGPRERHTRPRLSRQEALLFEMPPPDLAVMRSPGSSQRSSRHVDPLMGVLMYPPATNLMDVASTTGSSR
jgi:hypothetical protein